MRVVPFLLSPLMSVLSVFFSMKLWTVRGVCVLQVVNLVDLVLGSSGNLFLSSLRLRNR